MKFDLFLKEADKLGCDCIATGHYARRIDGTGNGFHSVIPAQAGIQYADDYAHLLTGLDENKDQTYFLCQLNQTQLSRSLFPIGDLQKSRVREIAREHKLPVAEKKDSQGICFVGQVDMQQFLEARISPHNGNIITTDGKILGQHRGFEFYTIGQRGGLGIGGGTPLYVVDRRPETNEVIVAVGAEDPALFRSDLVATNMSETIPGAIDRIIGKPIVARIRYRQPLAECVIENRQKQDLTPSFSIHFTSPQRAVAPGQFIAFYEGEELIGSGIIA